MNLAIHPKLRILIYLTFYNSSEGFTRTLRPRGGSTSSMRPSLPLSRTELKGTLPINQTKKRHEDYVREHREKVFEEEFKEGLIKNSPLNSLITEAP